MKKSLFKSKTFWLNLLTAAASVAGGQFGDLVPTHVAVPILAATNIGLRIITSLPIRVLPGRTWPPE